MEVLGMLVFLLAAIVGLAYAILARRDRKLKRKGKTNEQIKATSKASVKSFHAARYAIVGLLLTIGGIGEALGDLRERQFPTKSLVIVPIGIVLLWLAFVKDKERRALTEFVNSDPHSSEPPDNRDPP
jgi:hypothetical protein